MTCDALGHEYVTIHQCRLCGYTTQDQQPTESYDIVHVWCDACAEQDQQPIQDQQHMHWADGKVCVCSNEDCRVISIPVDELLEMQRIAHKTIDPIF
jgi:hypothetical protein